MTNTTNARQSADQVMAAYIIDISYQPFDISARAGKRNAAVLKLLWFRLLRPLLVLLTWAVLGGYAHRCFLKLETIHVSLLVVVCQVGLGLFLILLALLGAQLIFDSRDTPPAQPDEDPDYIVSIRKNLLATVPDPDSIMEIAAYAELDRQLLSTWQNDRSLVAYHDEHGHFRSAAIRI
ncbi:hypothetical protein [Herbaspirillum autotrophicum]|uniref:hypothetical protein n=1 Tax=Herbaspirillum autotrophicum TaxID=180195 RepID=UPI00067C8C80|nr:hypothetical protein [Herbaspirillum autotrophicum]